MVTNASILNLVFFTYSSITVDPLFVLVASDDVGSQHIGMLLMVW